MDIPRLAEDQVYAELGTSPKGLTTAEAAERLRTHGANTLPVKAGQPLIYKLAAQFTQLFAILLEVAAVLVFVAAMLSHGPDRSDNLNVTFAIIGVVILNAAIGFLQEFRAEKATEALRKLVPATAKAVRDGEVAIIAAADLVPGDVVVLEEGDAISADSRLTRQYEMSTNNIALTGESDPVRKTSDAILDEDIASINMPNMVFMGTSVAAGNGRGVVVATGLGTEFGRIFTLTTGVKEEKSPLQVSIDRMARLVSIMAIFFGVALFVMGRTLGLTWVGALLFALGVMVALVPEGLPATLSVALAVGVQRMARQNALIKKLSAVETLGSTNVICTDKTGTLTKAEMTVKEIWLPGVPLEVTGAGYEPQGEFVTDGRTLARDEAARLLEHLNRAMTFCNDAKVLPPKEDKGWRVIGDPTEGCLLVAAEKAGFDLPRELAERPKIYELPFDSVRKRMSVVHADEAVSQVAFAKGAPGETIACCTRIRMDGKAVPLTDDLRAQVLAQNDAMAREALRVLAVCERDLPAELTEYTADSVETDLTLIGLVGMIDPPRPEVAEAVEHALTAGIRIIMVTGDYGLTAEAIARRIGIARGDRAVRVVTGVELDAMGPDKLKVVLQEPLDLVFARVAPEHKMQVVAALKDLGAIVAVTGDGVNDAPALKRADIGVAMGLTGTDVSREAATMILLDDSFASIIKAVEQGRGVYANIKKMVTYIYSHNFAELFPFVFAVFAGVHLVPLTALQVLSIDLGSDVLPGLSLGVEHPEPGVMKRPPRPKDERLMSGATLGRIFFIGCIQAAWAVGGFLYVLLTNHWHWGDASWAIPGSPHFKYYAEALMMTQATIVMCQFFNGFACRTERESLFKVGLLKNKALLYSEIFGIALIAAISYLPPLQHLFKTGPLTVDDWLLLLAAGISLFFAEEARKWVARLRAARPGKEA
jgi:P-type Ca2+ transporter type 2C